MSALRTLGGGLGVGALARAVRRPRDVGCDGRLTGARAAGFDVAGAAGAVLSARIPRAATSRAFVAAAGSLPGVPAQLECVEA